MILDTVNLENFGIYRGRQSVSLAPSGDGRPIVLFGGLNGCGKTTFLDAVQVALFGPKARCSNRGKLGYREYLRTTIHRDVRGIEGASISLSFRRMVDGKMRNYSIARAWRETGRGLQETVKVTLDGKFDALLTEQWDEYIENYIPSSMAHLFFFDAEQIKDLAEGERAAELVGNAIHSLLGLDLVGRLETDLLVLERRKKISGKEGKDLQRLQLAEEELARLDVMLERSTQEKARITGEADLLAKEISNREEQFRRDGGDLFRRRKELEANVEQLEQELAAEDRALRHFLAGPAPLGLVTSLLKKVEVQARLEADSRKAALVEDVLEERDISVIRELRKRGLPKGNLSQIDTILRKDRNSRSRTIAGSHWLPADDQFFNEVRHLRLRVLPKVAADMRTHFRARSNIRERLVRLESTLARVPESETIAQTQSEIEALRVAYRQKQGEVESADMKLQIIMEQRGAAEKMVTRVLGDNAEKTFASEDIDRVIKHSAKVRSTLDQFRTTVIRKHAARIERLMLESFNELLRKSSLITELKIDPDTFSIRLTGTDGRDLPFERLSAGERQLLATSLLWGLARASGRPLPTIIDTPLGRLDSSHRRHLVDRYFPVASHQVILLSTDEEIDQASLERLRPYIGRTYHLEFDDKLRSTRIRPGYFWEYEAAC
jgi:DNA sulfur modification protein DndD